MVEAHWYYNDFLCYNIGRDSDEYTRVSELVSLKEKEFIKKMSKRIPFLKPHIKAGKYMRMVEIFNKWRDEIPRFGAIILNQNLSKVLLVESYKKTDVGFPKGKLDEGETGKECAIREMKEEINFDISPYIHDEDFLRIEKKPFSIDKLFIVHGIPETQHFKCNTRREINSIKWYKMDTLKQMLLNEADDNRFRRNRQFIFLLGRWIDCKKQNIPFTMNEVVMREEDRVEEERKSLNYFQKACNAYFIEGNTKRAFYLFRNCVMLVDQAEKSLEYLIHFALTEGDGPAEARDILFEFKDIFYNN